MSISKAALAGDDAGQVAEAASDSTGFNIGLVVIAGAILLIVWRFTQTMGNVTRGFTSTGRGVGNFVSEGANWWLGGGADVVENTSDFVLGGTADTVKGFGSAADDVGDAAGDFGSGVVNTLNPTRKGFF